MKKKKHFVKEIFIFVLLLILIMLMLAVALYDFIPSNISMPEEIEYTSDSATTSIKQEIAYTNGGDQSADESFNNEEMITSLKSYSIQASDLTVYGQKNLYNSGNSNPFDYAEEAAPAEQNTESATTNTTGTTNTTATQNGSQSTTTTTNTTTNDSTTGTFFENPKSK